jgi:negative regulator of sigma-B (phosphoserine phosphatase)
MSSSYCGSGVAVVEQLVEWATATRVRPGERVAGDLAVLAPAPAGAIIAAVDGLGHGPAAARAARVAVREACLSAEADIATVTRRCHRVLRYTRGAALSVGLVASARRSLTWLGVGNVEGRLLRAISGRRSAQESLLLAPGLPGRDLPELSPKTLPLDRGDVVIFATDGVAQCFADDLDVSGSPAEIAERIMTRDWKADDDAVSVVARYLGGYR